MSMFEAEAMGGRLVLVASQAARTEALIGGKDTTSYLRISCKQFLQEKTGIPCKWMV